MAGFSRLCRTKGAYKMLSPEKSLEIMQMQGIAVDLWVDHGKACDICKFDEYADFIELDTVMCGEGRIIAEIAANATLYVENYVVTIF